MTKKQYAWVPTIPIKCEILPENEEFTLQEIQYEKKEICPKCKQVKKK